MSGPLAGLTLEPACTLREADDLHFSLLAMVLSDESCLIDGGAVERVDTAGLQMLAAFFRQRAGAGRRTGWTVASPELQRCATRLGLDELLQLSATDAGATPCR